MPLHERPARPTDRKPGTRKPGRIDTTEKSGVRRFLDPTAPIGPRKKNR